MHRSFTQRDCVTSLIGAFLMRQVLWATALFVVNVMRRTDVFVRASARVPACQEFTTLFTCTLCGGIIGLGRLAESSAQSCKSKKTEEQRGASAQICELRMCKAAEHRG